jgi:GMP synthase (glutamine-hydrolysing)
MVIACLHHLKEPFSGHAGRVLRAAGARLDERDLRRGDPLPALEELDGLLSLGGEQSVVDIAGDEVLLGEAELLREAVHGEVPVLGVCLGAQVLAHALGGRVAHLPRRLLAWAPLERLPAAAGDPVVGALPPGAAGLHWNEDGIEPPAGAVELLRRPAAGAEAFRVGARAWGVQFHPEVDAQALEGWYRGWPYAPGQAGVSVAAAHAADSRGLPGQRALSEAIFGGFAGVVAGRARAAAQTADSTTF